MSFVHLHVHTEYSTDAISKIDELFLKAEALGMPGLAITDHGTISGVPEFLRAAGRHPSVKPIVGCEFWLSGLEEGASHLILLAKNSIGYKNLVKLVSFANTEGLRNKPLISKEKLTVCREGLICTSACIGGEVPQLILKGKMEEAKQAAQWYKELFGEDFYFEVSLHKCSDTVDLAIPDDRFSYMEQNRKLTALQTAANSGIFQLSEELGIKVVASNDVHFVSRADGIAQDVMLAIQHGKKVSDPNRIRYSHMEYLKAEEEMRCLFPDHPEVIDNTNCILDKVERYSIWEEVKLPKLSDNPNADLRDKVYKGMILRHLEHNQRIEEELKYIEDKGIADYFLIIKDLVDWVRSKGWAAGPGRGSSSGSLVNYCLGISSINPLEYNLLFERFVSSSQNHFPVIDIDLEPEAMENIYDFFKEKFGCSCVSRIATFELFGSQDAWSKTVTAMDISNNSSPEFQQAKDVACKLEKVIERTSVHSCGWLVYTSSLGEIIPVQNRNSTSSLISMYDARSAEEVGVLRLNILSLRALKIVKDAFMTIRHYGENVEPDSIPLNDGPTIKLFSDGDSTGVFLFESAGIRKWLRKLHPSSFNDIVAMHALFRPGPADLIPKFVARKNGEEAITYPIAEAEKILGETYGLIIYQEQIIQLAEILAGFSPEKADNLRKALGKRILKQLSTFHDEFIEGGSNKGYDCNALEKIWEMMNEWPAVNKSQAVCYTWISYKMAWLKAHYPLAFYLSLWRQSIDMPHELKYYIQDALQRKLPETEEK